MIKTCPECLTPLDQKNHKIFHCWTCPEDHGTLYAKSELEKILAVLSGLGHVDLRIWEDRDRYSVIESSLISPKGHTPMLEIRDRDYKNIMVYADPDTHDLWLHTGEEEKLLEHIQREASTDAVSTYLLLAAKEAAKVFEDGEPIATTAGHTLTALKLLGERILRAVPFLTL